MACDINVILGLHIHDEQLVGQRYMAWGRRNINIHAWTGQLPDISLNVQL